MGKRRVARERALQILYEIEFNDAGLDDILRAHWADHAAPEEVRPYTERLVRGIVGRRDEVDGILRKSSANWRIARMTPIDRNILRIAVFEMMEPSNILAPAIVIDEAIEIAKRFSGDEAALFINGVLDAVRKSMGLPDSLRKANDHEQRIPKSPGSGGGAAQKRPGAGPRRKS